MAERREEKYIISYAEFSVISHRLSQILLPDANGDNGRYSICSMYFDDPYDKALDEKEDGLPVHTKFRIRTYNGSTHGVKLERKTKRGIVTEKNSAPLAVSDVVSITKGAGADDDSPFFGLVSQMTAGCYRPKICVRYDRLAFYHPYFDVRVTFDTNIDALPPEAECLFGDTKRAIPALPRDKVIMEIKYGDRCPSFVRRCCACDGMQLSVSKYALCRNANVL